MRWYLYTDRSVYVLSYDALIGQKDTAMRNPTYSLEQFKATVGRIELQTERGVQLKKALEVDMPCGCRCKVLPDKYSTLYVEIFPQYDENRPIPCNQFDVSFNLHKEIYSISVNSYAVAEDYITISHFMWHIERIMRSIA